MDYVPAVCKRAAKYSVKASVSVTLCHEECREIIKLRENPKDSSHQAWLVIGKIECIDPGNRGAALTMWPGVTTWVW